MIRLMRNMPRKLTAATFYSSSVYCNDATVKGHAQPFQLQAPAISSDEFFMMVKRMNELEEKVIDLSTKPAAMPAEKEELLNAAMARISNLEEELSSTKKVFI